MQTVFPDLVRNRFFFLLALTIYAFLGSPTPDSFGGVEIAIFIGLVVSLRPSFSKDNAAGFLLLAYGISIPLLASLIQGRPAVEIIRDIVPFGFLLMPVLYSYRKESDTLFLISAITAIGLIFSMRSLLSFGISLWSPQEWNGTPPDLLYLANSPEVLFSAVVLLYYAGYGEKIWLRLLCASIAVLPLLAMATLIQRACLAYMALLVTGSFLLLLWRNPKKAMGAAFLAGCSFLIVGDFFSDVYRQLSFKTQMVGLNSRGAEWAAVLDQVSASFSKFLFGLGWGTEFEDPAVGGLRVNFTHSLISSLLLKSGLTGITLFLLYSFDLLRGAYQKLKVQPLLLWALAGPLAIGLGLYASYKSLGYGLLLLLLSSLYHGKKLEQTVPLVS